MFRMISEEERRLVILNALLIEMYPEHHQVYNDPNEDMFLVKEELSTLTDVSVERLSSLKTRLEILQYIFELGATDYAAAVEHFRTDSQICVWLITKFNILPRFIDGEFIQLYIEAGAWNLLPGSDTLLDPTTKYGSETYQSLFDDMTDILPSDIIQLVLSYMVITHKKYSDEDFARFDAKLLKLDNRWYHASKVEDREDRDNREDCVSDDDRDYHSASAANSRRDYGF